MNKFLTKLANNDKLSTALVYAGIALVGVAEALIFTATHYRGVSIGVETRDNYYFEKEKAAYEEKYGNSESDN